MSIWLGRRRLPPVVVRTAYYVGLAIATFLLAAFALDLRRHSLDVPFDYESDTLFWTAVVKAVGEDGWPGPFRRLGAPFGFDFADWPNGMPLDFAALRLLVTACGSPGMALNLYWLLSLPAAAMAAACSLRRLGLRSDLAFALGMLYGLQPYAFYQHTLHFPLVYPLVPLQALLAIRIAGGETSSLTRHERALLLLVCGLQGLAYVYYSFFSAGMLSFAGLLAWARSRSFAGIRIAAVAVLLLVLGTFLGAMPSLAYWERNGRNPEFGYKTAAEADHYGLRLRLLLTPIDEHPLRPARAFVERLRRQDLLAPEEPLWARLGATGSVGFLALLAVSLGLWRRGGSEPRIQAAAALTLGAVLLAVVGGFGSLFAALVTPDFRVMSRIVVFIGLFALFAFGRLVEPGLDALARRVGAFALASAIGLLTVGAAFDQMASAPLRRRSASDQERFRAEQRFVETLEAVLPRGSMVFQLPHTPVPIDAGFRGMGRYDHARLYLHSRSLRWSWGAVGGRHGDWHENLERLPVQDLLTRLNLAGFAAVLVDRFGYPDRGRALEKDLGAARARPLVESRDGRYRVFRVPPPAGAFVGAADLSAERDKLMSPVEISWQGCQPARRDETRSWRWCTRSARLRLTNPLAAPRRLLLSAGLHMGSPEGRLLVRSAAFSELHQPRVEIALWERTLVLDPFQRLEIEWLYSGEPAAGEPYAFQLFEFAWTEPPTVSTKP